MTTSTQTELADSNPLGTGTSAADDLARAAQSVDGAALICGLACAVALVVTAGRCIVAREVVWAEFVQGAVIALLFGVLAVVLTFAVKAARLFAASRR